MTDDKKTIEALPEIAPGKEDIASFRRSSRIEAPKQSKFNGLLVFTIVVMAILMGFGAVAFGFHEGAVVANGGIEVFVAGDVGAGAFVTLPDATGAVDKDFIEPALMGLVGFLIAEVPLAKNSGSIASRFQNLGKYRGIKRHALAFEDGVCDAILERMAARHESGAGG